uniref:Uncharacterized protein n=1 Tax=Romanomermis culicivorax TaxID=13658 RepID=A0A915IWP3_ROMCU
MPSWPEMPTPRWAVLIMETSLAPSPMAKEHVCGRYYQFDDLRRKMCIRRPQKHSYLHEVTGKNIQR